jgi:hypothetical protein
MSAICKRIIMDMEEEGEKWHYVIDTVNGVRDVSSSHEFLPETGEEKIVITVIRRTKQSKEYATYIKQVTPFRRK